MYMGCSLHIYIEHRISKLEKRVTTSLFRYETFYYLWVKGFDERKRHSLSILAFSSSLSPNTKVSASKRKPTVLFGVQFSTHWLFQNLPKSSLRFRCVTSLALCNPISHLGLLWHLWMTRPHCVRAWTPVLMLHLTNPCAEPKGSQPN